MKATETNLLKLLKTSEQFVIPIYQRSYNWTQHHCKRLLDDIIETGKKENLPTHFLGSVVYIFGHTPLIAETNRLLLIDGQQRITSVSLLLAVLRNKIQNGKPVFDVSSDEINEHYLLNKFNKGELKYKILLNEDDRNDYIAILKGEISFENNSSRLLENFKYFQAQIENVKQDELEIIYKGIGKLSIVEISLDRTVDNPQLIFESLNSTGLALTQSDLIRNYILMALDQEEQDELYKKYWQPMERSFGKSGSNIYFDRFIRDYLTIKLNRVPKIDDVYEEFKKYRLQIYNVPIVDFVKDIYTYSTYYIQLASKSTNNKKFDNKLKDIGELGTDVVYPFLMAIYNDYKINTLDQETFLDVLQIVESYIFRRSICGIPTNRLTRIFATLYKEIDKSNFIESLSSVLILKQGSQKFPTDTDFKLNLTTREIYHNQHKAFLLRKLETHTKKEVINFEELTIEHVLPQDENLSAEWKKELGENWEEDWEKYLHTLGNLTLTGYNTELSNKSFRQKKTMKGGFNDSPLYLNSDIKKIETWNRDSIQKRSEKLANRALKIWKYPEANKETLLRLKKEKADRRKKNYKLEDYKFLTGEVLDIYNQLKKRIINLDNNISEEIKKLYISFETDSTFICINPQKKGLLIFLNMDYDEILDPQGICKDVSDVGKLGIGNVQFKIASLSELNYAMELIKQSYQINNIDM